MRLSPSSAEGQNPKFHLVKQARETSNNARFGGAAFGSEVGRSAESRHLGTLAGPAELAGLDSTGTGPEYAPSLVFDALGSFCLIMISLNIMQ